MVRWQEVAKQDLKSYKALKESVVSCEEKINIINADLYTTKGMKYSPTPRSGGGSVYEDRLIDGIVEKERLTEKNKTNLDLVRWIEKGLNCLSDEERDVLDYFYITRPKRYIDKLMAKYYCSKTTAYEMKDKALKKFTCCMYGLEES